MTVQPQQTQIPKKVAFGPVLNSLLKTTKGLIATSALLIGVLLHYTGMAAYRSYLSEMGIDKGPFNLPTDAALVQGFESALEQVISLVGWLFTPKGAAAIYFVYLAAYVLLKLVDSWGRKSSSTPPKWLTSAPKPVLYSMKALMLPFACTVITAYLTFLVAMILIGPAFIAQNAGRQSAEHTKTMLSDGCFQKNHQQCHKICSGNDLVVEGYLVASSPEYIGIYEPLKGLSQTFARSGLRVIKYDRLEEAACGKTIDVQSSSAPLK